MIHLEKKFGFSSSTEFIDFIEQEVLPNTGISVEKFWGGLARIVKELTPKNRELLETRSDIQSQVDEWHKANQDKEFDLSEYKKFLHAIGYIVPQREPFSIDTENVDPEISSIAGPQLVVPRMLVLP